MIKSRLQELTREKTKYNVEKLTHDLEFCQSEMGHLSHEIADLNRGIIHQINVKKNLVGKYFLIPILFAVNENFRMPKWPFFDRMQDIIFPVWK